MPRIITCSHEEIAVEVAHGYAKAAGKAMAAVVHNVVGLLHGAFGIYYAYLDRIPVIVVGGCGSMSVPRQGYSIIDGQRYDREAGDLLHVQGPHTDHQHFNTEDTPVRYMRIGFTIRDLYPNYDKKEQVSYSGKIG